MKSAEYISLKCQSSKNKQPHRETVY